MNKTTFLIGFVLASIIVTSCATVDPKTAERHRWWAGLGPVLPHDSFPSDCKLCHVGETWNELSETFQFDHFAETGVPLRGAHGRASCLMCHNDRGPVAVFNSQGCAGCHEDFHFGELGSDCSRCHNEQSWQPHDILGLHNRTRFPLSGAHAAVSCNRCHLGAFRGDFVPTDTECVTCHTDELQGTTNPPHIPLGWVDRCDRCHIPTDWKDGRLR